LHELVLRGTRPWFRRAYDNLDAFGVRRAHSTGWAGWGFVVPRGPEPSGRPRPGYRNAAFTSALVSTTIDQMPMGRPRQQQGEMQGTMAMIETAMAMP
jgi:hypothetical protein